MHRIDFKLKTLFYFLMVAIIPFVASWGLIYRTYDSKMHQDFKEFSQMQIHNQINKIEQLFRQQEIEMKSIAQAFSHLDLQNTDLHAFLRDQKSINRYFMDFYIIMPDGTVYSDSLYIEKPDIDFLKPHTHVNAKNMQELTWIEPYTDPVSGVKCIGMSIPLLNKQGEESGVLVGNISLKTFGELLENVKSSFNGEVFFINSSGYVKYHSGNRYGDTVNIKDAGFVLFPAAEAIKGYKEGYREYSYLGRDWICSFMTVNSGDWKVVSLIDSSNLKDMFRMMNQGVNTKTLYIALFCILSGLLASLFLSNSITYPLTELRDGVRAIAAGNLDSRVAVRSNDEVREVAEAFNEMAAKLKKTYTELRNKTNELYLNNRELYSMNMELKASYGQLEAAIAQLKESDMHLRKKYDELQTLNKISHTLTSAMDLDNMLNAVASQVVEITEALVCVIRLVSSKNPYMLELKALKGAETEKYDMGDIDIRKDTMGQAIYSRNTIVNELNRNNIPSTYYYGLYVKKGAKYAVFAPLRVKSEVIGIMSIIMRGKPDGELIELINSLSNNLAIAIDNSRAYETLRQSYLKTVQNLVSVVEAKDEYTESHSIRVAKYSSFIAQEMKFSKGFVQDIWVAGVLHDIGKIGIEDSLLKKKGSLTDDEYNIIKQHPEIAFKIASKIGLGENILKAIRHHHERYDGRGYPDMIKGEEIPIMASIISVADAFDAITSNRPYRKSKSMRQGMDEIVANSGTQFNPAIVRTLERMFLTKSEIFEKIYNGEDIEFF